MDFGREFAYWKLVNLLFPGREADRGEDRGDSRAGGRNSRQTTAEAAAGAAARHVRGAVAANPGISLLCL